MDGKKGPIKKLRQGYTTGSCAAGAAQAAAWLLVTGKKREIVSVTTPKGNMLPLKVVSFVKGKNWAEASIRKDSGDDPDITNGVLVYARVEHSDAPGIQVDGGIGIGRVTKEGLSCPIGAAAINPVPKKMIVQEVFHVFEEMGLPAAAKVTISIPAGVELAKKTYNPRLGIVGGLSVLGTSGIVEPMSETALIESICLEMRVRRAEGRKILILTPGNYGEEFLSKETNLNLAQAVKCSNFIGEALDEAVTQGWESILLVGHLGKLVKLAGGIMNTHSHNADCRMEILTAHAGLCGADRETLQKLMECITTDQAVTILDEAGICKKVLERVAERIHYHMQARVGKALQTEAILFSLPHGLLAQTGGAIELLHRAEQETLVTKVTE